MLKVNQSIVEDWGTGYKVELEIENGFEYIEDWSSQLSVDGTIRASYGVENIEADSPNMYQITGSDGWSDLYPQQTIAPILIVDRPLDTKACLPTKETSEIQEDSSPKSQMSNDASYVSSDNTEADEVLMPEKSLSVLIEDANAGDKITLEDKTYILDEGVVIDKLLTIEGSENTIIDAGDIQDPAFSLFGGATGSTIKDFGIENANVGIRSYEAENVTIDNIDFNNIGLEPITKGKNNTAVSIDFGDGISIQNSSFDNIGRKAIGVNTTDTGTISNNQISNVNLDANHSQAHDAAGIKLFNTNEISITDNYVKDINGYYIWNDTASNTKINGNDLDNIGDRFLAPDFTGSVSLGGIYNEKSVNSVIDNNQAQSDDGFTAFTSTKFSTDSLSLGTNDFDSVDLAGTDFWVNREAEIAIAETEDPLAIGFEAIADEYYEVAEF